MKSNDIKKLTTEEIQSKILEIKEELFTLRFQLATGNIQNPTKIREYRRTIARMKTIISERQSEAK